MLKYFFKRLVWVFIVLFSILTITFVFLKIQPEYPPTKYDDKKAWLVRQMTDGFMIRYVIDQQTVLEMDFSKFFKDTSDIDAIFGRDQKLRAVQDKFMNDSAYYSIYTDENHNKPVRVLWVFVKVPISTQYFVWLTNVVTKFDWGYSTRIHINEPATNVLNRTFKYTIGINLLVLIIEIPFGLLLGTASAIKKDKLFDNIVSIVIMVFISLPSFVVIMLLMKWFGSDLKWLPYQWVSENTDRSQQILRYVIPVTSLTLGGIAGLSRRVRAELAEELTQDYVLLARTKGLTKRQSIFRHAFRIALTPILPGLLFSFLGLLGGAGVTETVYGIPGAGRLFIQASLQGAPDYNVILYNTAFFGFIGLFTGILIDMSYNVVDPRIKMGVANAK